MNVARAVFNNFGAKVLAVLVAVLVWFNASGQEQVVRMRPAALVLEGLADSLAITNAVPAGADVRVSATRRQLVSLGLRKLVVAADLTGLAAGRQRLPLTGDHVRGIGSIPAAGVQVNPSVLELDLEPVARRRLQVALATTGSLGDNLLLLDGGVEIEPAWVTLRGPVSVLERVHNVTTETLDLSRVRESGTRELSLVCAPNGFACEPERVAVTVRVSPRGERVLANVPPTLLLDTEDVLAEIEPATVSLTLDGPAAVLDTLSSGDVSVLLTLSGRAPASYRLAPEVILPPGVRLSAMSVDTFLVRVSPAAR